LGTTRGRTPVHAVPLFIRATAVKPPVRGLTLIEVLIALVVLGVGILALSGSSSLVTRMIGRGKVETQAALAASRRVEMLRAAAGSTVPRCAAPSFASGGPVIDGGLRESWSVSSTSKVRSVRVVITYLTVRGPRSAVLETTIEC
jgi:prepilin-type N-terminal cleavage/methylation domain-containing protein